MADAAWGKSECKLRQVNRMRTNSQNDMTDARQWMKDIWPAAIAQALGAIPGPKVEVDCLPIEGALPAGSAEDLWWQAEFSMTGGASLYIGSPGKTAEQIGRSALMAANVSEASAEDAKSKYREITGQSLSAIAQGLSRGLNSDVACINGRECQQPMEFSFVVAIKPTIGLEECGPIRLAVSREFDSLFSSKVKNELRQAQPNTMDLLFDVELPVSVSFGRTQLPLKDVIKLTTGSIVELNRSIMEPVEVIVNNCVIARGEVVVIEGNYGVRIQQIISRQERLRTLH